MFTLDANIFIRNLDVRDPEHHTCSALLSAISANSIALTCPTILLAEVAGSVRRTWNDPMRGRLAAQLVGEFPNLVLISVDSALGNAAAEIAADHGLRGMDAIYVAVALTYNCTLVTLDDEPLKRAGAIVRVVNPAEALALLQASI